MARLKEVIFERLYEKGIRSFEPAEIFKGSSGRYLKKHIYDYTYSDAELRLCNLARLAGGRLVFQYEGKDYPIDGVKQFDAPLEEMNRDLDAWLVGRIKEE